MKPVLSPQLGCALLLAGLLAIGASCGDEGPVSRLIGARCDAHSECDERCLGPNSEYPGGFCSLSCNTNADCPADALCVDEDGGICLFECRLDEHCTFLGPAWNCMERDLVVGDTGLVCRGD